MAAVANRGEEGLYPYPSSPRVSISMFRQSSHSAALTSGRSAEVATSGWSSDPMKPYKPLGVPDLERPKLRVGETPADATAAHRKAGRRKSGVNRRRPMEAAETEAAAGTSARAEPRAQQRCWADYAFKAASVLDEDVAEVPWLGRSRMAFLSPNAHGQEAMSTAGSYKLLRQALQESDVRARGCRSGASYHHMLQLTSRKPGGPAPGGTTEGADGSSSGSAVDGGEDARVGGVAGGGGGDLSRAPSLPASAASTRKLPGGGTRKGGGKGGVGGGSDASQSGHPTGSSSHNSVAGGVPPLPLADLSTARRDASGAAVRSAPAALEPQPPGGPARKRIMPNLARFTADEGPRGSLTSRSSGDGGGNGSGSNAGGPQTARGGDAGGDGGKGLKDEHALSRLELDPAISVLARTREFDDLRRRKVDELAAELDQIRADRMELYRRKFGTLKIEGRKSFNGHLWRMYTEKSKLENLLAETKRLGWYHRLADHLREANQPTKAQLAWLLHMRGYVVRGETFGQAELENLILEMRHDLEAPEIQRLILFLREELSMPPDVLKKFLQQHNLPVPPMMGKGMQQRQAVAAAAAAAAEAHVRGGAAQDLDVRSKILSSV